MLLHPYLLFKGDARAAITFYQKALKIDNKNINILFSLASTYQGIGKFDEAKKIINQILELDPNNTASHKLLSGFINYKDNQEHLNEMESLLKKNHLDSGKKLIYILLWVRHTRI